MTLIMKGNTPALPVNTKPNPPIIVSYRTSNENNDQRNRNKQNF